MTRQCSGHVTFWTANRRRETAKTTAAPPHNINDDVMGERMEKNEEKTGKFPIFFYFFLWKSLFLQRNLESRTKYFFVRLNSVIRLQA